MPRRHRAVPVREGPVHRPGLVGGAPAGLRAGGLVPRRPRHRPGHLPPADGDIETSTEIAVVPEDSAEVRRVTVTNNSDRAREIELTSYGEIVLAPPEADRAHPAFGNLFVETEWHEWCTAITATRRPRSATEASALVRARGRHRQGARGSGDLRDRPGPLRRPGALDPRSRGAGAGRPLCRARPARCSTRSSRCARGCGSRPGQSASVAFTTLVATSRERAFELADRYRDPHAAQRALDLAWTSSQIELRELEPQSRRLRGGPGAGRIPVLRQPGAPGARRPSCGGTAAPSRCSGPTASRATGRSCWRRSIPPTGCRRSASCSRRTATGAATA